MQTSGSTWSADTPWKAPDAQGAWLAAGQSQGGQPLSKMIVHFPSGPLRQMEL